MTWPSYLLDTDALSLLFRRDPAAVTWFNANYDQCATSTVTYGELMYGALNAPSAKKYRQIMVFIRDVVLTMPVLSFETMAAQAFAEVRMLAKKANCGAGNADLMIASIAAAYGLSVVTRNVSHFSPLAPLVVIAPI